MRISDWSSDVCSTDLAEAVIAAEDNLFCRHHGFDWESLGEVIAEYEPGEPSRGASTITMQTAKNLFLWPARSFLRKAAEAWLTVLLELAWDKRRILEVYLNVEIGRASCRERVCQYV